LQPDKKRIMNSYLINVGEVENLQNTKDVDELERIFLKAKSTIVNGESVILVRKQKETTEKFDELTTLTDLDEYRKMVFKYLY
jgi:hypothetical protein